MKRMLVLILSLFVIFSLVGCGNIPDDDGAGLYVAGTNTLKYSWSKMVRMGWIDESGKVNYFEHHDDISGKIVLPKTMTAIPDSAFGGCQNLEEIIIPESVVKIGDDAFGQCTSLVEVTIPGNVDCIGYGAFTLCSNLKKVVISEGTREIEEHAFNTCESLIKIIIPNSVKKIGENAFYDCENLEEIIYNGTKSEWISIDKPYIRPNLNTINFNESKNWDFGTGTYVIRCTDGQISKYEQ